MKIKSTVKTGVIKFINVVAAVPFQFDCRVRTFFRVSLAIQLKQCVLWNNRSFLHMVFHGVEFINTKSFFRKSHPVVNISFRSYTRAKSSDREYLERALEFDLIEVPACSLCCKAECSFDDADVSVYRDDKSDMLSHTSGAVGHECDWNAASHGDCT